MAVPPSITIGELEAKYPLYCKALRMLLLEGRSAQQLKRTLCWERLNTLHHSLPRRYRHLIIWLFCINARLMIRKSSSLVEAGLESAGLIRLSP